MKTIFLGLLLLAQTTFASTTMSYEGLANVKLTYYSFGYDGESVASEIISQSIRQGALGRVILLPLFTVVTLGWPLWGRLSQSAESIGPVKTDFTAYLKDFENGRLQLILKSSKTNNCEGMVLRFLAEEDSLGGYKLFSDEEASSRDEVSGTLLIIGQELRLEVTSAAKLVTKGKANKDCVWHLDEGFQVDFNLK